MIKTYKSKHMCIRSTKNLDANLTWIAKKLEILSMVDPYIRYPAMRQVLLENKEL